MSLIAMNFPTHTHTRDTTPEEMEECDGFEEDAMDDFPREEVKFRVGGNPRSPVYFQSILCHLT